MTEQKNNPLHGFTLEQIINKLVEHYGWEQLGLRIQINCFTLDPSVKSSLKFLRKTPWARKKVEDLFIQTVQDNKYTNKLFGQTIISLLLADFLHTK